MVGVVVLVVAVIALHDPKNPSSPQAAGTSGTPTSSSTSSLSGAPSSGAPTTSDSSPATTSGTTSAPDKPTVAQLKSDFPLVVLNNTTIQGLAAAAAQRFEQDGWKVSSFGNLDNTIVSTCAYYDPAVPHAKAAARALQAEYPTIQRVEPKFDGLVDGPVVVVLTPGYSSS